MRREREHSASQRSTSSRTTGPSTMARKRATTPTGGARRGRFRPARPRPARRPPAPRACVGGASARTWPPRGGRVCSRAGGRRAQRAAARDGSGYAGAHPDRGSRSRDAIARSGWSDRARAMRPPRAPRRSGSGAPPRAPARIRARPAPRLRRPRRARSAPRAGGAGSPRGSGRAPRRGRSGRARSARSRAAGRSGARTGAPSRTSRRQVLGERGIGGEHEQVAVHGVEVVRGRLAKAPPEGGPPRHGRRERVHASHTAPGTDSVTCLEG